MCIDGEGCFVDSWGTKMPAGPLKWIAVRAALGG